MSQPRHARRQLCPECGAEHITRSGNRLCHSCRNARRRGNCEDCGASIDHRAKLCMACWGKRHTGANAHNWREGRTTQTHSGYILRRALWHPRATKKNPYVREHVLVMEQALGRYLLPGETVHHRNGIRHDNRLENLELWVSGQPAGQRVEDALEWAEELLRRYRPGLVRSPLTTPSEAIR